MKERESFEVWLQQQSQKPVHIESARQGWEAALSSLVPDGYVIEDQGPAILVTAPDGAADLTYPGDVLYPLIKQLSAAKEEGK